MAGVPPEPVGVSADKVSRTLLPSECFPSFRPAGTLLFALFGLGFVLLLAWDSTGYRDDDEALLYIERSLEARDGLQTAPSWQRWVVGAVAPDAWDREIIHQFDVLLAADPQPLVSLRYAVTLLAFGQPGHASAIADRVDDPALAPLVRTVYALGKGVQPDEMDSYQVEVALAGSDSWWSRSLLRGVDGSGVDEPSGKVWQKALVLGGLGWGWLGVLGLGIVFLRGAEPIKPSQGVVSRYGAVVPASVLAGAFLRAMVVFLLASTLGYAGIHILWEHPPVWSNAVVETVARLLPVGLFLLWFFPSWRIAVRALGLDFRLLSAGSIWFWFCLGMFVSGVVDIGLMLVAERLFLVDPSDFIDLDLIYGGSAELVSQLVVAALVAAVSEEILFRGVLFRSVRQLLGPVCAAVLTSALFASVHFYSPLGMASVFSGGLIFCWLTYRTGSLWPAILVHAAGNALATWSVWWFYAPPS